MFVDSGDMNEFEVSLLASTFLGDIVNLVAPTFAASEQAARIEHNLDTLPTIAAADNGPVFVWAHVPAPHQPTVLAADGSVVAVPLTDTFYGDSPMERGEDPAEFRERYRAQLAYLNGRILETVDAIVSAVGRATGHPPVRGSWLGVPHGLDRCGAHGSRPRARPRADGHTVRDADARAPDVYPDDASPIDLFRVLFDAYFGTDYGRPVPPDPGGQIPPVDASVLDE